MSHLNYIAILSVGPPSVSIEKHRCRTLDVETDDAVMSSRKRECGVHPSLSFEVPPPLWPRVNQGPTAMMSAHLRPATGGPSQNQLCPNPKLDGTYICISDTGWIPDDRNLAPSFMVIPLDYLSICGSAHFSPATCSSRRRYISSIFRRSSVVPHSSACQFLLAEFGRARLRATGRAPPSGRRTLDFISFIFRRRDIGHSLRRAPPCKLVDHLMDMITGMTLLKTMTKMPRAAAAIKRRTRIQGG
ncbi:hypothetical protein B0H13DRAFT_1996672 [Mycena leptocephala]|nr:hypothetical protein B0H13DRAFT_1996672 [Mycena leptocephala]